MNFEKQPRGTLFALALIVAGALLFLDNLGVLPIGDIGAYWPLALVVYGFGTVWYSRSVTALIWSAALIVAGVLLILGNLHILRVTVGGLWPLLLIALGATMLANRSGWGGDLWARLNARDWPTREERLKWRAERWRRRQERWGRKSWRHSEFAGSSFAAGNFADSFTQTTWSESRPREVAVFFGAKRRVETQEFQGGELVAVFGSIEIDLTGASMQPSPAAESDGVPARRAVLEVGALFGAIEIVVPRTWRVIRECTGIFGSCEDRTIPRPEPGVDPATLVVRGGAVFGSVTIRN